MIYRIIDKVRIYFEKFKDEILEKSNNCSDFDSSS